jgi:predicted transcriptional regulator
MKSSERYELIQKGLSEGKKKSEIAREMEVTPALISQVIKKHTPVQEVVEQQAA